MESHQKEMGLEMGTSACSLTVPESLVLELIQIKTTIETCSEFAWGEVCEGGSGNTCLMAFIENP